MLHDAVRDYVAGMYDVFVARFKSDLVNQAPACESEETSAGDGGVTPVC